MLCAKCRQATPRSDDTWCLGCSATESLNSELSAHWHCEGLRALSHEVVVGAVRTVRSLRLISSGLKSAEDSRAALERRTPRPLPAPRGHSVPPPPPAPPRVPREPKREEESEEGEESESEEEEAAVGASAKCDPSKAPPEPELPPRHQQSERAPQEGGRGEFHSEHHRDKKKSKKRKDRDRTRTRGGSKHPRLYRVLENPDVQVHRRLPPSFLDERPSLEPRGSVARGRR